MFVCVAHAGPCAKVCKHAIPSGRDAPLMSGGLLALSRRWWEETGGYDTKMVAWGGENIDQSLRSWLCGGRIEVADGAFVAHMWRDPKNPKTVARLESEKRNRQTRKRLDRDKDLNNLCIEAILCSGCSGFRT